MKREDETTPIINCVGDLGLWQNISIEMMAMHGAHHTTKQSAVEWMKAKLGRQSYTWVGEFRFWVWERNNWRVYVSNQKGIGFEVRYGMTEEQAYDAWQDYRRALGLRK